MAEKMIERRSCERFVIPGATACYKKDVLFFPKDFKEEFYPVFDISRGGLRLACPDYLDVDTKVSVKIVVPGDEPPLVMKGRVTWNALDPEKGSKYQIGIQFARYGEKMGENSNEALKRITKWEERFRKV